MTNSAQPRAGGMPEPGVIPQPATPVTPPSPTPVAPDTAPVPVPSVGRALSDDPLWFKKAVFYEVWVRSFADSTGTGTGDLNGLIGKLDYLAWLGVDCIWIPPFFRSPERDGGYDVELFTGIQVQLGTHQGMKRLLDEAHARGIRVISDFVLNHTSADHPWFVSSREDPQGPYGDYFVWRDDDSGYPDARIIFVDTEESNWTFDPVRKQFYWHRFYSHQPDLNYDNPKVVEEILDALRFWLELGVDGFRLDAVPYLVEEEGTNCENLPGTHAILKQIRAMVDAEFPGRMLLAEANQWPKEVVEYFGEGDEFHMAFHFPVMPRLFMALKQGSRKAISEILADTPPLPEGCQWATFLRNHDELTLEMVTEDERQYLWNEYAPVQKMRLNLGIRRRLAPLLDNDERQIRLLHALLLALPGSPVLYYGDEIGMGDHIWLPDRDGVRTPMQWTSEVPGAGFSDANPYLFNQPIPCTPPYGAPDVNVADQQADPDSLLNWLRHILAQRRAHEVFGLGDFTELECTDAVMAFERSQGSTRVICLNNLTAWPQLAVLELDGLHGRVPAVLSGSVGDAPEVVETNYRIELPPYGYMWLLFADPPPM
ncbi:maltose alpha-D-glucosyltransferase [Tessaracoccus flavus]|uniref:maltose alpha-D-glucosyltransferase n=1 Tax=Tessaracoccus flavus TaxID=1610493 RepID=UPI000899F445|nr:maltose alpha-D-glucosyltransferase [Tessaracoccus flavus]SDY99329.1 maltose alpha-D-glucosyltransferase/ alpha-amylase [Tessaracoccus flavus]